MPEATKPHGNPALQWQRSPLPRRLPTAEQPPNHESAPNEGEMAILKLIRHTPNAQRDGTPQGGGTKPRRAAATRPRQTRKAQASTVPEARQDKVGAGGARRPPSGGDKPLAPPRESYGRCRRQPAIPNRHARNTPATSMLTA